MNWVPLFPYEICRPMNRFIASLSIGRRLTIAFGVLCLLLLVVAGAGLAGNARQSAAREHSESLTAVRDLVQELRYLDADISGWQAYVYVEAAVEGTDAFKAGESWGVEGLTESRTAAYAVLEDLEGRELSDEEQELVRVLRTQWDEYFAITDTMIALITEGTPQSMEQAYTLLSEDLDAAWLELLETTRTLTEVVHAEVDAVNASGEAVGDLAQVAVVLSVVLAIGVAVVLATVTVRSIVRPLHESVVSLNAMARGDLTVPLDVNSKDEIGHMAQALTTAQRALRDTLEQVARLAGTVAGAAEELSASNTDVAEHAEDTSSQVGVVAAAAEQVSRNVQTVAAGAEQMGASIREIAANAQEAARASSAAVNQAQSTAEAVTELGESSQLIGNVVKVISSIAEQTNLLALNATIEAARAGDAGKGFAVVASEVKDLAAESARAAEDIARRITLNQEQTASVVAAISSITDTITSINDYQMTIASAVEEQTATTTEMSRSVAEAATGVGEIASNSAHVAQSAQSSATSVGQMKSAVDELAGVASDLRQQVGAFTY